MEGILWSDNAKASQTCRSGQEKDRGPTHHISASRHYLTWRCIRIEPMASSNIASGSHVAIVTVLNVKRWIFYCWSSIYVKPRSQIWTIVIVPLFFCGVVHSISVLALYWIGALSFYSSMWTGHYLLRNKALQSIAGDDGLERFIQREISRQAMPRWVAQIPINLHWPPWFGLKIWTGTPSRQEGLDWTNRTVRTVD